MSQRNVPSLLHDLAHHAARVADVYRSCASRQAFLADHTAKEAILWNFVVIGEVCARLGVAFHREHSSVPWRSVIAQRNIIAHGYDIVDWDILVRTIEQDIPVLIREVRAIAERFGPPPTH